MRKIILLALSSILLTPSAWAVSTTNSCPNPGWIMCDAVTVNPTEDPCCAPSWSQCDAFCGGGIGILVPCKDQPCEGQLMTWMEYVTGKLTRCPEASESAKCEYMCKTGYYRANPGKGAAMMCLECPDHASCIESDVEGNVSCAKGYYREVESSVMHPGQVGLVTTYMCTRCPSYNVYTCSNGSCSYTGVGFGTTGTSSLALYPNAKSITECYIPANVYTDDNTGVFQVTSACYYKTTSSVIPIYPAN